MKLLIGYTLDYIRRNRRGSLSVMFAILMVTTMLSALCGFCYNMYVDSIRMAVKNHGDWHGELFDVSYGRDLETIERFESVEALLIKGQWRVAKIDDPRRDYLVYREADANYWSGMSEKDALMEGRIPAARGEIALSKQYFEHHPELKLGDTLTLPLGERVDADGALLPQVEEKRKGERFEQSGEASLTVVGKLDIATSSVIPCYTALGYLDRADILPDDEITIYMRFHNIRDTYRAVPEIASAVGYKVDEYGQYNVRYNAAYLSRLLIYSPQQLRALRVLEIGQIPALFTTIGLLAVAVFVLIIHNAFALSANARLTQLGVLASIGATPRQIRRSVLFEALALSVIPAPVGILLGQLAVKVMIDFINYRSLLVGDADSILFVVGWLCILPAVVLTLLTVVFSARIPARRVAKLSPIDAIRHGESLKLKRPRRFGLGRLFGLEGELAGNALRARSRSYRTATISLLLSFLTLICLVCITSAADASKHVYATDDSWAHKDISIRLDSILSPEDLAVTKTIGALPDVQSAVWYNELTAALWVAPQQLSEPLRSVGGYEGIAEQLAGRPPLLRDGEYRIYSTLIGLDEAGFAQYCAQLGLDPAPFYGEDRLRAIVYNQTEDTTVSTRRAPVMIPHLKLAQGDMLELTEKLRDETEGDARFEVETTALTTELPLLEYPGWNPAGRFGLVHIMPMHRVNEVSQGLAPGRMVARVEGILSVTQPDRIKPVRAAIEAACESVLGSGDYGLYDEQEYALRVQTNDQMLGLMFGFFAGLFALIGLSNAWTTVLGNLNSRRREFAMLRSVGIPPRGIRRMLAIEALLLGLTPLLMSLPAMVVVQAVFLSINEVTLVEWLPFVPWPWILLYTAGVLAVITVAYALGGSKLLRENIVEAIKLESV